MNAPGPESFPGWTRQAAAKAHASSAHDVHCLFLKTFILIFAKNHDQTGCPVGWMDVSVCESERVRV